MPKCPNCGLETARTEDWACQWCAYPLISGGYKKLPMTFRQLQAEKSPAPEPPARVEPVPKSAPEPEATTEAKPKPVIPPEPEIIPEPEVIPLPEAKVIPEPEVIPLPEPEVIPEPIVIPLPGPEVIPEPEVMAEPEVETEPVAESVPASEPEATPEPETKLEPEPEPVIKPEPTPTPEPAPALEPHPESGIIEASVAQLNAAYRQDKAGTNAKLKDSLLQVTGVVGKIVLREHLGIQYLLLSSGSNQERFNVRCTFGSQQGAALRRLTEGETVTVKGSYGGYERNIMLRDCDMVG